MERLGWDSRAGGCANLGHWSLERYRVLLKVSGGKERIRRFLAEDHPDLLAARDVDGFVAALHKDKTRRYTEAVIAGLVEIRPGVARQLGEAKAAGLKTAIATTTSRANVDALLQHRLAGAQLQRQALVLALQPVKLGGVVQGEQ